MAQWEYKVVVQKLLTRVPDESFSPDLQQSGLLNSHGSQGWELVTVINQNFRRETDPTALYGYTLVSYFLKRPLQTAMEEARHSV
jgi:hypothetical protein